MYRRNLWLNWLRAEVTDNKGQPNGYADLDNDGLVPVAQIPPLTMLTIPSDIIVRCDSAHVPSGWHICDGTGGTPDLSAQTITSGLISYVYIIKL